MSGLAGHRKGEFVDAYARRLGRSLSGRPDERLLVEMHRAHVRRIPFENLSIHLGEPLSLDRAALADKVLTRGRGGFCYELNGLFASLLEKLGFRVTLLGARVWDEGRLGPPLDHLALLVEFDTDTWLADVGFGDHSDGPLRLDPGADQFDDAGVFRLELTETGDWDVLRGGVPQYRIEWHPRALEEFDAMCWYQQTSPRSQFTRSLVCTIRTEDGRVTLSGRRLTTTVDGVKTVTELDDDLEVLETYPHHFGIVLDRVPEVRVDLEERST